MHGVLGEYEYGPWPPPKGADEHFNRLEDFAESVTTFVYPGEAQQFIRENYTNIPEFRYENYYRTPRAVYVAGLLGVDPDQLRFRQRIW